MSNEPPETISQPGRSAMPAADRDATFVLISGHMGSGKSALRQALHGPPHTIVLDDLWCFNQFDVSFAEHIQGLNPRRKYHAFQKAGAPLGLLNYWLRLRLRSLFRRPVRATDVMAALRAMFPRAGIIGDVANHYQHFIPRLAQLENVKQIIVYRDARDVAAEMRRRLGAMWQDQARRPDRPAWLRAIETPGAVARHWGERIELMEGSLDAVFPLRYETLVTDPPAALLPLADWLGLPPDRVRTDIFHAERVGSYREVLTQEEVAEIEAIAGPALRRLGYL